MLPATGLHWVTPYVKTPGRMGRMANTTKACPERQPPAGPGLWPRRAGYHPVRREFSPKVPHREPAVVRELAAAISVGTW